MNPKRIAATTMVALAAALAAGTASACEITRTPWGLRITGCNLSYLYKGRFDAVVERAPSRTMLRLPNLHATDIDSFVNGSSVNLSVDVENNGDAAAPAFEVAVIGTVHDPLDKGGSVSMTPLPPVAIAGLAVGATASRGVGAVVLPNRNQDWDVCATAVVDPPLTGGSASGNVFESNESDNVRDACCRVYGPKPDVSGPPAC